MKKFSRRSFLQTNLGASNRLAVASGAPEATVEEGTSRRAFLEGTAGAAAGAGVIFATPKVASLALDGPGRSGAVADPRRVVTEPSGPPPYEPVTAYVRNAELGEVTVMSGKQETTFRDPVLVKRMLDAAH